MKKPTMTSSGKKPAKAETAVRTPSGSSSRKAGLTPGGYVLRCTLVAREILAANDRGDSRIDINGADCNPSELHPMAMMLLAWAKEIER